MILNDEQLQIAKSQLNQLKGWIAEIESREGQTNNQLRRMQLDGFHGFAYETAKDIEEYEDLRQGNFQHPETIDLSNLPKILVLTRIVLGWTQEKLAQRTNTKLDDLRRYESNCYLGASLSKQIEIAEALDIDTSACFRSQPEDETDATTFTNPSKIDSLDLEQFPVQEVFKRGWIHNHEGICRTEAFKNWLVDSTGPLAKATLHRKGRSGKLSPDMPSVLTWQARILQLANSEVKKTVIPKFMPDERWFKGLVAATVEPDGPAKVKKLLLEHGIVFIVERHLPKTYLDGAAMLSHDGVPVVALTLRRNRLDFFWFTLFHELAHVYLHLFTRHHVNFFDRRILRRNKQKDLSEQSESDEIENEADRFAQEKLIDPAAWEHCLSRHSATQQNVLMDAQRLNVHPSIIAGRLRKESNDSRILGNLLGQGSLHPHFDDYKK